MTKTQMYIERLLRERPTHTRSGVPIKIMNGGHNVKTFSGRDWYGRGYSFYVPTDYPQLFGWKRQAQKKNKPPLLINNKGYRYLRIGASK